ncbi:MAG: DUF4062 domain-containing protein [Planctomycetaceae bacterium]|nr:DUF4062 domain-containing protein [Planctomycetales bacterium]MCB9924235.1 DUF4062 domain-containing protein [Planctomycetaceae bacterium]
MSLESERVIRVFVSSTFRDMQEERDELVLRIFPQLRRLCEERAVTWGEVDLRWGITEEQAERGEVLPICMEEIRRCRPYFIGLLGERYEWIPDAILEQVLRNEPWIRKYADGPDETRKKSVTESVGGSEERGFCFGGRGGSSEAETSQRRHPTATSRPEVGI